MKFINILIIGASLSMSFGSYSQIGNIKLNKDQQEAIKKEGKVLIEEKKVDNESIKTEVKKIVDTLKNKGEDYVKNEGQEKVKQIVEDKGELVKKKLNPSVSDAKSSTDKIFATTEKEVNTENIVEAKAIKEAKTKELNTAIESNKEKVNTAKEKIANATLNLEEAKKKKLISEEQYAEKMLKIVKAKSAVKTLEEKIKSAENI